MRRFGNAGFTLLEAMVAIAIVGLAAVAALETVGAELRTAARARHALNASALAEHHVETIRVLPAAALRALPDSAARGRFPAPLNAYSWTTAARAVPGHEGLYDVRVQIVWDNGTLPLATRIYRPEEPQRP